MKEEYKEYREKWDSYPHDFIQEKVPIHLDLEITTNCQLKCIMCARRVENTKPMNMDIELMKKIIKEFGSKGGYAIKFCYLGEPTLFPYIVQAIKYAKEMGIVDTRLATNGLALTPKLSKDLIEAGLDLIIFSIDSIHPQTYKNIRIGSNLGKVVKNLAEFRYLRDKLWGNTQIQVQAIPIEQNKMELLFKYYHDFYREFADTIFISPWCKDYSKDLIVKEETPNFFCPAPFRRLLVRVNGDIWLCCGDPLKEKFIGNYNKMSLEEAWKGTYLKDVRKQLKNGNVHLIPACKKCSERWYKQ
jgi:MoaA/NifB/PqqE/SkfB family radical SAM enzyme